MNKYEQHATDTMKKAIADVIRNLPEHITIEDAITVMRQYLAINYGIIGGSIATYADTCVYNAIARRAGISPVEYLRAFVRNKVEAYTEKNDKGAYGDILEVLVRLYCKPRALWQYADIRVRDALHTDATLRGHIVEIGHCGKEFGPSWVNAELFIYAALLEGEKEYIAKLVINGAIDKALETVGTLFHVMPACDMARHFNAVSRGKGLRVTSTGKLQVVYNSSKSYAIAGYLDENTITLQEWIASIK